MHTKRPAERKQIHTQTQSCTDGLHTAEHTSRLQLSRLHNSRNSRRTPDCWIGRKNTRPHRHHTSSYGYCVHASSRCARNGIMIVRVPNGRDSIRRVCVFVCGFVLITQPQPTANTSSQSHTHSSMDMLFSRHRIKRTPRVCL